MLFFDLALFFLTRFLVPREECLSIISHFLLFVNPLFCKLFMNKFQALFIILFVYLYSLLTSLTLVSGGSTILLYHFITYLSINFVLKVFEQIVKQLSNIYFVYRYLLDLPLNYFILTFLGSRRLFFSLLRSAVPDSFIIISLFFLLVNSFFTFFLGLQGCII